MATETKADPVAESIGRMLRGSDESRCPNCKSWETVKPYARPYGTMRHCLHCGFDWREVDDLEDTESAEASTA